MTGFYQKPSLAIVTPAQAGAYLVKANGFPPARERHFLTDAASADLPDSMVRLL